MVRGEVSMRVILTLAALGFAACLLPSAQGATAVSAQMSLMIQVDLASETASNFSFDEWAAPLSPLAVQSDTMVSEWSDVVSGEGSGNAVWTNPNAGSVSFEDFSWYIQKHDRSASRVDFMGAPPDYSYTFVAGADDFRLRVAYDIVHMGAFNALHGWVIQVDGGPEGVQRWTPQNGLDPTASGVFMASLTPGSTYQFSLMNGIYFTLDEALTLASSMRGNFVWEVTPVPEPATCGLLTLGLGLLAGVTRQARSAGLACTSGRCA